MNPHELKALKSRLQAAKAREDELRGAFTAASRALREAENARLALDRALREAQKTFTVSEHAVLRYAERALGLDPAQIAQYLGEQVGPLAERLGNGRFPIGSCLVGVVENNTLVTVVTTEEPTA